MYAYREELLNKSRTNHKDIPSFSSTLLDEIYRSIDVSVEKPEAFTSYKEKPVKKPNVYQTKTKTETKTNIIEDEETRISTTRACLVDKWMEREENDKIAPKRSPNVQDNNDVLFFSSTSSSNSDSSGALSSSDTEFFSAACQTTPKVSCFSSLKPIRTGSESKKSKPKEDYFYPSYFEKNKTESGSNRALKIYANLKKIKQPISPGGRLTSFINSIFEKKPKSVEPDKRVHDFNNNNNIKPVKAQSACSFSRSCLSKYSPRSREKLRGVDQRTVRFHPVSVIVDQDSRPCGHKCIYGDKNSDRSSKECGKKPPLPKKSLAADSESKKNESKGYNGNYNRRDDFRLSRKINCRDNEDDDYDDDFDGISESSSDLFELDFDREELPVYETTRFVSNRVVASRLIR